MKTCSALVLLAVMASLFVGSASAQIIWEAFNDHRAGVDTSPNATTWEMRATGSGGPLKDIATGDDLTATMMVEEEGATDDFGANSAVDPGSPVDLLFAGKCTIGGADNPGIPGIRNSGGVVLRLRFENLTPGKRYRFRGATCRGNNYVDRWAIFKIIEADSAVAAHVDGSTDQNIFTADTFPAAGILPDEVVLNSGDNKAGSLIGWDEIDPGADGAFAIEARQYVGEAPFGTPSAGPYAYGLSALYLAEVQGGGRLDEITRVVHDPDADTTELTWKTNDGELFEIRKSLDLTGDPRTWPLVVTGVAAAAAPAETTTLEVDTNATEPAAFYKVFRIPPPPIFEDDFETDRGWITGVNDLFGNTEWQRGAPANFGPPTGAGGSATCFGTNIASEYALNSDVFLRSPPIDLSAPGIAGYRLTFQQFRALETTFDLGFVRILRASDDAPLGADLASGIDGFSTDWEKTSLNLPPEAVGETVRIEFQFTSDEIAVFAGWYIDDVVVAAQ